MRGRLVAGAVLGVLGVAVAGVGGLTAARAGEAPPGAAVEGEAVGGLERAEVRAAVERLAAAAHDGRAARGRAGGAPCRCRASLAEVDVEATVDAVMDDDGSPLTALLRRGDDVDLQTSVDRDRLERAAGGSSPARSTATPSPARSRCRG